MTVLDGFANVHPFFVHAPLVLIPTAAVMVLLGRKIRKDGFDTAIFLVTVAAAIGSALATTSGFIAKGTFPYDEAVHELLTKHQINGVVLTVITSVVVLLAVAEWRGWIGKRAWWLRAALLIWASIGTVFSGHNGATLVFVHGAAVAPVTALARTVR